MSYSRENIINNLLSNDNYIKWLDNFSNKHRYFFEDSWGKDNMTVSEDNMENASKMAFLFSMISEYSNKLNFKGYSNCNEIFFPFMHNNNYYFIGIDINFQSSFCKKVSEGDSSFIDYNDVKNYFLDSKLLKLKK